MLAVALAEHCAVLREALTDALLRDERQRDFNRLATIFDRFRNQVSPQATPSECADACAQILTQALFLVRHDNPFEPVTLMRARHLPGLVAGIGELIDLLCEAKTGEFFELRAAAEALVATLNRLDCSAVIATAAAQHLHRDPVTHFYEDFVKAYNAPARRRRGIYYTPQPIVTFIVRAIDELLKDSFHLPDGLADHSVSVLDFACGTGIFLREVCRYILENGGCANPTGADATRSHILRNILGFECLPAPWAVAHLQLSQFLASHDCALRTDERLQVLLADVLADDPFVEGAAPPYCADIRALRDTKPGTLVILGNPPYAGHSRNKGRWISDAIDAYKATREIDESGQEIRRPLGERNAKWLHDDYVKFIRWSQLQLDAAEKGILGIISNHSWLDNPTFRGMRQSLIRSFQQIHVIDLHGNAKKKERTPDGTKDENVFDIEQGVAISFFVKRQGVLRGIWRSDLNGSREHKYQRLTEASLSDFFWQTLAPTAPFYLFAPQNERVRKEYEAGWRLTEILPANVLGFQTHRDDFAISFTEDEARRKLAEFADPALCDDELGHRYGLKSTRDWSLPQARSAAGRGAPFTLQRVTYRPFDDRWSEFSTLTMDFPRRDLIDHVASRNNLVLGVGRFGNAIPERPWELAMVSTYPVDANVFRRGGVNLFPLWLFRESERIENISPKLRGVLRKLYQHEYPAEDVLGYVYAVLHAPAYRARYRDFLRIDFPRIGLPQIREHFDALSALGRTLVDAHLSRNPPRRGLAAWLGGKNRCVEFDQLRHREFNRRDQP